MELKIVGKKEK